ncbi:MAG: ribosomal RNA small subunit methyltransferase A [Clostridia bacterium]|nr:ribosomal RNA small subunit methyltransferase A [Clostridia bacterium]
MINSKELIKEYGIKANKALGQNFLVDESALAAITELADCGGKKVLEIGPGLGALTNELAQQADKVVCVEVDSLMCSLLEKTLAGHDCVTIINRDFLKVKTDELHSLLGDGFIVAANLPYYITSDSAMKLIDSPLIIKRMVLMMQQEAAEHFLASPKQKCYTPVSIIAQHYFSVSEKLRLPPSCYYPEPLVHSSVLLFESRGLSYDSAFSRLVRTAFSMRRKTLRNNLSPLFGKDALPKLLESAGLDQGCRAEELSVSDFERLLEASREI